MTDKDLGSARKGERCQLCGSLVEVVSSDEGTSCYRPAEQGDVEATDDDRLERIHRAFEYVPLSLYDEVTKLAEYALGEFIADRNRLEAALERAERETKVLGLEVESENTGFQQALRRAEKAELALAEKDKALEAVEAERDNLDDNLSRVQRHLQHAVRKLDQQ